MTYLRVVLLCLFVFAAPVAASDLEGDRLVIEALKEHGSDLSKPHTIDFFFDFPAKEPAEQLCAELATEGYAPHLEAVDEGDRYTCRAVKKMVPELEAMQSLTRRFNALARKYGGTYDGWGCPIEN